MTKFVRIRNKADIVDRRRLEKLGLSTKRDDEDTIGQFGSGAKLAPIAALRKDIRWITVSEDDNGPYCMEYVARDVNGVNTVFYKYDDYEKESSFTVDAGVLSWDEDFQIFREAFANALDEGDYSVDIVDVDEFTHEPGYVNVYLTAAPEVMEIIENFDSYFSIDRDHLVKTENGSVYHASIPGTIRVFNKHVFAFEAGEHWTRRGGVKNTYDWGFNNLELNEERRVKSEYSVEKNIAQFLCNLPDDFASRKFIKAVIRNEPDEFFNFLGEYSIASSTASETWANVWYEMNGDKAVPVPSTMGAELVCTNLRAFEYVPIVVSLFLFTLLDKAGVKTAKTILGDRSNIEIVECPPEHVEMFQHAIRTVTRYDGRLSAYNVETMKSNTLLGVWVNDNNPTIFIATRCLDRGFRSTVETLVHELDHAITGARDSDIRFRDAADKRIGDLIVQMGYDIDFIMKDHEIHVPVSFVSTFGGLRYKIKKTEFGSLMYVGNHRYFIDCEVDEREGVLEATDDETFVIHAVGVYPYTSIKKV